MVLQARQITLALLAAFFSLPRFGAQVNLPRSCIVAAMNTSQQAKGVRTIVWLYGTWRRLKSHLFRLFSLGHAFAWWQTTAFGNCYFTIHRCLAHLPQRHFRRHRRERFSCLCAVSEVSGSGGSVKTLKWTDGLSYLMGCDSRSSVSTAFFHRNFAVP